MNRASLFGSWLALVSLCAAKPVVVTTHPVLADFVQQVAGDLVEQRCLLSASNDPHTYAPKPSDVKALADADLVIINGLGLEPWSAKLLANSGYKGPVVRAAESLPKTLPLQGSEHAHDASAPPGTETHTDPHAWHNPQNAELYVQTISQALSTRFPNSAASFRKNASAYIERLRKFDDAAAAKLSLIPQDRRKLLTAHEGLAYFADRYGFETFSVSGAQPDHEPSAKQLAELVRLIRQQNVRAVFFEPGTSSKLIHVLATEAGVTVVDTLYTDTLGPTGGAEATYLGMMQHNVDVVFEALRSPND
jgi:zinc/manganese transport system substrate-binding protein